MKNTFKGGIHLPLREGHKELTCSKAIVDAGIPEKVFIPLGQHIGKPASALVKIKDEVKTGQLIGQAEGFVSANVHSSVTGTVEKIGPVAHPVFGSCQGIQISTAAEDVFAFDRAEDTGRIDSLSRQQLLERVKDAGVVGMGGAAFPTHVKFSPPPDAHIDTLVINASECEPYLTCDHRTMLESGREFILGLKIILRILNITKARVGVADNKKDAYESLKAKLGEFSAVLGGLDIEIMLIEEKYPLGAEKQMIKSTTGREVPPGALPLAVGVIVSNVGTVCAVFDAVCRNKPLYERTVTVSGFTVKNPGNFRVRTGTPMSRLLALCGGTSGEIEKLLSGGPLMGMAQFNPDAPVIKGSSGVLALSGAELANDRELPCISCARCVGSCPMGISPYRVTQLIKAGRYDLLEEQVKDCMECGSCAFICPSKIPLTDYMRLSKAIVSKRKK